jgi:tRNA(fMet)-specific endonuclease VapC
MSFYIWDTDHLSLYQRNPDLFQQHLGALPPDKFAITVITVEEQLRGRFLSIRQARTDADLLIAYHRLRQTVGALNRYLVLDYDEPAHALFKLLRKQKIRVKTQDLRIAATALSVGGILVTRNAIDFSQVPGLTIEDWSK